MFFEKKKIQIDTLGEYLAEIRQSLNLDLKKVSSKTGISERFIESLEAGDFCKLPADVYVLGFLKQLSLEYGIDQKQLIDQYKKEKSIFGHLQKKENLPPKSIKGRIFDRIVVTPKILSLVTGLLFIGATIFYIVWQVASLNKAPFLEIFDPTEGQVLSASFASIKGKTDVGSMVSVNDQPVFVDENGLFQTQIGVNNGPKDIVIISKNKFDKSTKKTISINVEIKNGRIENEIELSLYFGGEVQIEVGVDEAKNIQETFHKGDTKIIKAKKKIVVSTSNAGATEAVLNGQKLGPLGRQGEILKNVPFFAENGNINAR